MGFFDAIGSVLSGGLSDIVRGQSAFSGAINYGAEQGLYDKSHAKWLGNLSRNLMGGPVGDVIDAVGAYSSTKGSFWDKLGAGIDRSIDPGGTVDYTLRKTGDNLYDVFPAISQVANTAGSVIGGIVGSYIPVIGTAAGAAIGSGIGSKIGSGTREYNYLGDFAKAGVSYVGGSVAQGVGSSIGQATSSKVIGGLTGGAAGGAVGGIPQSIREKSFTPMLGGALTGAIAGGVGTAVGGGASSLGASEGLTKVVSKLASNIAGTLTKQALASGQQVDENAIRKQAYNLAMNQVHNTGEITSMHPNLVETNYTELPISEPTQQTSIFSQVPQGLQLPTVARSSDLSNEVASTGTMNIGRLKGPDWYLGNVARDKEQRVDHLLAIKKLLTS